MTLVEFLHPLRGSSQRNLVLGTMYYLKRYKGREAVTAPEVKAALTTAKIPKAKRINVNNVVNRAAPLVHSPGGKENGALLFALTDMGDKYVRELLDLPSAEPEIEHDVATLTALLSKITDEGVRGYLEEAVTCLRFGGLRASVVFLWAGAIRTLHEAAIAKGDSVVNAAIQRQDPKARQISKVDDFAYVRDRTFLDASPEIGILDKGQKETLVEALNLRNRCGHPTKYDPGPNKVGSFIEDVIGIVFA
ncbi:MAG: hypothetical protein ACRDOS_09060 [Gaiellaceae bacterium]